MLKWQTETMKSGIVSVCLVFFCDLTIFLEMVGFFYGKMHQLMVYKGLLKTKS
ncbi:hypothetical protein DSECCO2_184250 [anaerobic digester metagenome]